MEAELALVLFPRVRWVDLEYQVEEARRNAYRSGARRARSMERGRPVAVACPLGTRRSSMSTSMDSSRPAPTRPMDTERRCGADPGVDAEADVCPPAECPDPGRLRGCPPGTERAEVVEVGGGRDVRPTLRWRGWRSYVRSLAPTKEALCLREGCDPSSERNAPDGRAANAGMRRGEAVLEVARST